MHGMPHANNNLDTFLNTAVDCTLAMGQFIAAAEAIGLGTCPISYVRSHIERVTPLLALPPGVYPVAGLSIGWPVFRRPVAMRLPPSVVVHRERYDDSKQDAEIRAYDERRRAREPVAAGSLKNNDVYPPRDGVGWSENVARQLSVPERFGFAAYLKTRGFDLA
jgi:nitroreductase/FMN reductase [NAD(P)H]